MHLPSCLLTCVLGAAAVQAAILPERMSTEQIVRLSDYLVPLPKKVEVTSRVRMPIESIRIQVPGQPDPVVGQALLELRELLGLDRDRGTPGGPPFTIRLVIGGPETEPLEGLPNREQAYRIVPADTNDSLLLAARTREGLYYAAKTLQQALRPGVHDSAVEIPLLSITDWPDMEDRGLWGTDNVDHLVWLGERKMNIVEQISSTGIDEQGRGWGEHKKGREPMSTHAYLYAIKAVPAVLHLEQVSAKGFYQYYPATKAKGGQEGALCYSAPETTKVLAEWIASLAGLPNVHGVDVWLTENLHGEGGCQCEGCKKEDRSVLEAKVVVAAWRQAQRQLGRDIPLYTLTSEETDKANPDILKVLPREVRLWYYHSLLTYTTGDAPMIPGYLAEAAASGRWIGVCPGLINVHFAEPFTSPHFIHARMNEFVDKKLQGLLGYATPRVHYARFNVEAAAEWGWNAKGRSPHDFARSYAVRNRIGDPELFARWSDTLGPVTWDVYGSDFPVGEQRDTPGHVAKLLREGKLSPLGEVLWGIFRSPWGDIKTVDQLNRDVAAAEQAAELAKQLNVPACTLETQVVRGYIQALKALWELKQIVGPQGIDPANKSAAQAQFRLYFAGLEQARTALPAWEELVVVRPDVEVHFTKRPIEVLTRMIAEMEQVRNDLGVEP